MMTVLTMSPNNFNLCIDAIALEESSYSLSLPRVQCDNEAVDSGSGSYAFCQQHLELEIEPEIEEGTGHPSITAEIYIQPTSTRSFSSSSSSSASSSNKTVRFSIQPTKVHDHIHRNELTPQEKASAWLSISDMRRIKEDIHCTRAKFLAGKWTRDTNEYTQRGIMLRKQSRIFSARSAVLDEQERQRAAGIDNPMLIVSKYMIACQESLVASQQQGKDDFEELHRLETFV